MANYVKYLFLKLGTLKKNVGKESQRWQIRFDELIVGVNSV